MSSPPSEVTTPLRPEDLISTMFSEVSGAKAGNLPPRTGSLASEQDRLIACAGTGDLQGLISCLTTYPSLLNLIHNGATALITAASSNQLQAVDYLLSQGALVDLENDSGFTALELAARRGSVEIVQRLLWAGADVNKNNSAVTRALFRREEKIALALLDAGLYFHIPRQGADALCIAAGWVGLSCWRKLLDAGASFRGMERIGIYALLAAKNEEWAQLIVHDAGLDLSVVGLSVLTDAVRKKKTWMVTYLLRNGVEVKPRSPGLESNGLVHTAARVRCGEIVQALLKCGADVNALSAPGYGMSRVTALWVAVESGSLEMVEILLSAGADVERRDQRGRTILHSKNFFRDDIFNSVINRKAELFKPSNINLRDHHGSTPLHIAAQQGSIEAIERLIDAGADIHLNDNHRITALGYALRAKDVRKVKLLLNKGADIQGIYMDDWRTILKAKLDQYVTIRENTANCQVLQLAKIWDHHEFYRGECGPGRTLFSQFGVNVTTEEVQNIFKTLDTVKHVGPDQATSEPTFEEPAVMDWLLWEGTQLTQRALFRDLELADVQNHFAIPESKAQFTFRIRFGYFVHEPYLGVRNVNTLHRFTTSVQYQEIAWTMASSLAAKDFHTTPVFKPKIRSFKFLSSLRHGWLPRHGMEFFSMLISEIDTSWKKVFDAADFHLKTCHKELLIRRGRSSDLIEHLLHDAQTWGLFHDYFDAHKMTAERFVRFCREHSFLYEEVQNSGPSWPKQGYGGGRKSGGSDGWDDINIISQHVTSFAERCESRLLKLERKTRDLIQLEFNLVSIYEAQKSTSMAASMKRLSWITFVFLPLMFVGTLFGMNVDILHDEPSWRWFLVWGIVVQFLVMAVWGLFKFTPLEDWLYAICGRGVEAWSRKRMKRDNRVVQEDVEGGLISEKGVPSVHSKIWMFHRDTGKGKIL